ncbi:elongation factor P 5-aminopentanone reductase [Carnobacterium funditum]|uniref:elongation factor P 5-aminopentanone reductase n=1 Tax=Carnobacterium funditum TaxID=2752 RepID=UPI0005564FA7|nr:SDR family oxidoreductase [Carnobacterium funditum]
MKSALIMGASGDIGAGIAKELAESGWSLYLHYHTDDKSVGKQLRDYQTAFPKQDFFGIKLDMTDESGIEEFVKNIFQLDAIIFSSGFTTFQLLTEVTSKTMDDMWAVHVKTPLLMLQTLQTKLAYSRSGRVVFISSIYGESGSSMEVIYSTTKGAQLSFVKAYSKEVASLGITVNAISPGAIETKMNSDFSELDLAALKEEIPVGRMGSISEISFWVHQLLEPRSAYLTGQSIIVSGGWLR